MDEPLGDFPPDAFRAMGHAAVERLAKYFETLEGRPVLARTKPGEVLAQMPRRAPEDPEPWEAIERDLDLLVEPNLTHWQHPGYLAYFANTGTAPAIVGDFLAAGRVPVAVVATAGTTTVTSVDPLGALVEICERENVWLHVDAAYAGSAAALPEMRSLFAGWERADSVIFNPHKWLLVPLECSALFFRRMERVRRAFSVVPSYLDTPEGQTVREYMDYGIQLGRRFRALKMWMTLRAFGASGVRARLRAHLVLARALRGVLEREPGVTIAAPTPFSVVAFRWTSPGMSPAECDAANARILARINEDGRTFISHAIVSGRYTLRVAIGNVRTERRHLQTFLQVFREAVAAESPGKP